MEDKDENYVNNEDEDDMSMILAPPGCNMVSRCVVPAGRRSMATVRKPNRVAFRMPTVDKGCFIR